MRTAADAEQDRTLEIAPPIDPRADWRVAGVQALPGNISRVRFNDATEGEVDLSQLIQALHAGVFAALRDETLFRKAHVALAQLPGGAASTLLQTQCTRRSAIGASGSWVD